MLDAVALSDEESLVARRTHYATSPSEHVFVERHDKREAAAAAAAAAGEFAKNEV